LHILLYITLKKNLQKKDIFLCLLYFLNFSIIILYPLGPYK
jgi:hypothetical protein